MSFEAESNYKLTVIVPAYQLHFRFQVQNKIHKQKMLSDTRTSLWFSARSVRRISKSLPDKGLCSFLQYINRVVNGLVLYSEWGIEQTINYICKFNNFTGNYSSFLHEQSSDGLVFGMRHQPNIQLSSKRTRTEGHSWYMYNVIQWSSVTFVYIIS